MNFFSMKKPTLRFLIAFFCFCIIVVLLVEHHLTRVKNIKIFNPANRDDGNLVNQVNGNNGNQLNLVNRDNGNQLNLANRDDGYQLNQVYRDNGNQLNLANRDDGNQLNQVNRDDGYQLNQVNRDNGNQLNLANRDDEYQLNLVNHDNGNQLNLANRDNGNQLNLANRDDGYQLNQVNRDNGNQLKLVNRDEGNQHVSLTSELSHKSGTKKILINTYMRSGSTFLGKMLGHHEDAFYFYEPLHKVWTYSYTNGSKLCRYMVPKCVDAYDAIQEGFKYLIDVYNCKLHLDKINNELHIGMSGLKWKILKQCEIRGQPMKECLTKLEDNCRQSKYRVLKVLRLSLADASLLLPKLPNLTIIHLFRDPRGIINSHIGTHWFPLRAESEEKVKYDIIANCNRLQGDIMFAESLVRKFPNRVKLVQYEDIDSDVEKVKLLYNFTGMELPRNERSEIYSIFRTSKNRTDFLSGPFKYRETLSFKYIEIFNQHCAFVIDKLGFKLFKTEEELHDPNINPMKNGILPFAL
ncbi:hypothetical protein ACF0H5_024565 [Mactra antiquata]